MPLESGHKNHSTGDEAGLEKQVDPRIASKIQELVASGKFYFALNEFARVFSRDMKRKNIRKSL